MRNEQSTETNAGSCGIGLEYKGDEGCPNNEATCSALGCTGNVSSSLSLLKGLAHASPFSRKARRESVMDGRKGAGLGGKGGSSV